MNSPQKPFKSIDEEVEILRGRGLNISNLDDAKEKLLNNNYYSVINGYKYPFLEKKISPQEDDQFKNGTSFDELFALYEFDGQLRALLLKYILRVEHQLKSVISHIFAAKYRDVPYPDYLGEEYFGLDPNSKKMRESYDLLRQHVTSELKHQLENNNPMLTHYHDKFQNYPPWVLISILSFGMTRTFYCCLKNQDQNDIGRKFNLRPAEMTAYLSALNIYRNSCTHDERIYNKKLKNKITRKGTSYNQVYVVILILKDMLDAGTFMAFYSELEKIISILSSELKTIDVSVILQAMGMPVEQEVRKDELGAFEIGNVLSSHEFENVLKHYILPIIPVSAELIPIATGDSESANPKCALVEYKDNCLYFAQSKVGNYLFRTSSLPNTACGQIKVIEEHLSTLIDYTHVFWNLSNLSVYGRDKVEIAFPNLCEQAYELTICNLLCKDSREQASQRYRQAAEDYRRKEGEVTPEERFALSETVKKYRWDYNQAVKDEIIAQQSIYKILNQIEVWASKTYEGQRRTFGIIFCKNERPNAEPLFSYIDFLKSDYSATINDGIYSAAELYADGSFKAYIPISYVNSEGFPSIPYPFTGFAELCTEGKIGVLLTASGDILLISNKKLVYTRHNGFWLRSNADKAIEQLKAELGENNETLISTIYQTITDLSYSRGGACIGIVDGDVLPDDLKRMIETGILSAEPLDKKRSALKDLICHEDNQSPKTFYELDRHLRRELLELDGAMVFSKSGLIHVIGTIIKLNGIGNDGGGRTAAAMQLSEYGLSIKISQDGYVQLFKNREIILEILT